MCLSIRSLFVILSSCHTLFNSLCSFFPSLLFGQPFFYSFFSLLFSSRRLYSLRSLYPLYPFFVISLSSSFGQPYPLCIWFFLNVIPRSFVPSVVSLGETSISKHNAFSENYETHQKSFLSISTRGLIQMRSILSNFLGCLIKHIKENSGISDIFMTMMKKFNFLCFFFKSWT